MTTSGFPYTSPIGCGANGSTPSPFQLPVLKVVERGRVISGAPKISATGRARPAASLLSSSGAQWEVRSGSIFRSIVESPAFRRSFGEVSGLRLKRVPKGFSEDDPAAEYLKLRQFLAGTERPAEFATRPRFYGSLVRLFQQLIPFVRFLNEPLTDRRTRNTDLLSSG